MKSILMMFLALNLSACASVGNLFKSEEQFRQEHFAAQANRTPEQVKIDQDKLSCVGEANAYAATAKSQNAVYLSCMQSKGHQVF